MKIKYLHPIIGIFLLLLSVNFIASAASVGDFRSKITGNWSSAGTWESYNGTAWVAASSYPGQTLPAGDVMVSDGHTVTLNVSPAATISSISIGAGTFLIGIGKENNEILKTTLVSVNTGGLISFSGSNTALRILENGIIILNGGLLSLVPCNNQIELWIGPLAYAACVGQNAEYTFAQLNAAKGSINVAPSSNSPICYVNSTSQALELRATASGVGTGFVYSWTGTGPGYSLPATTYGSGNLNIAGLVPGTYSFTVTARDSRGYTNAETISVTVNPTPSIVTSAAAANVAFSASAQNSTLAYSSTTNSPSTYSIDWDAVPANSPPSVTNSALPLSPISIAVPANTPPGTYTGNISVSTSEGCVSSSNSFTLTIGQATPTVTASAASNLIYDGTAKTGTGTATGVQTPAENLTPVTLSYAGTGTTTYPASAIAPTNTGTYTITASFAGNAEYNSAISSPVTFTISKAAAVISVSPYTVTYDGNAHTSTFTAVGVEATPADLTGLMTVSGTTHTNAGTYSADAWSFAGNSNYLAASGTVSNQINQATSTLSINVTPYSLTYDGAPHTATGTATGAAGENLSALLDLSATTHTAAGTYNNDAWTFAGDANHAPTSGTVNNVIGKAAAVISVSPYTVTYDGNAHTSTFTAVGVEATPADLTGLMTVSGTTHTNAGTYSADAWSFAGNSNYLAASGTVSNQINQATSTLSINVTPYSLTYDGAPHTATGTATGAAGENLSALLDLSATTHTAAGTYNNDAWTFAGDANHAPTSGTVNNVIGKAAAVISVSPYTVTYDGNAHTSTFTAVGVEATPADLTGLMTVSGTTHTNAGTYSADAWSFAGNSNYLAASGTVSNQINQATSTLSINVTPYSLTYDGAPHTATGTATGAAGENLSALLDLSATTHTAAGTYNNDAWTFAGDANHAPTSGTVNNVIGKAAAVISVSPYTVTYDGNAHTSTFTAVGVEATPADLTGLMTVSGTTHTNAGTYSADAWSFAGNSNYLAASGTVSNQINQATSTLSINVTPYSLTYDGAPHTATGTATGAAGENLSALLDLSATTHTAAGTYNNDAWTFAGDANHAPTSGTVNNVIGKAAAVISVSPYTVTYDGNAHTSTFTAVGVEATPADLTGLMTVSGTTHTNAGTYSADAWSFAGNSNYLAASGTVSNQINQATSTLSINVTPYTLTYDGAPHTATGTATGAAGENLSALLDLSATTHTAAGTYNNDAWTFAGDANHAPTSGTVNNVIGSRALTISADPKSKTYGDADPTLTYQITSGTLATGDAFTGSLTRAAGENVGTYAVALGSLTPGNNYDFGFTGNDLTITPKTVTVVADAKTKVYGAADPALTYVATGLESGDVLTGALDRAAGNSVGTYAISQGTVTNSNYTITYTGADLTITPKTVTVVADAKTIVYGAADPALTYVATGLESGDVLTGALDRAAGNSVGTYAISQGTVTNSNYTITYTGADLTITPKTVTVVADAKTIVYGAADPALTYVATGLESGDVLTGALDRAAGNSVGTYAISQGTVANSNYTITYTGAELTITPKTVTVVADAKTKVYGTADPALTYVATGLESGDAMTGSLDRVAGNSVGTYAINQGTVANSNYNITYAGADLTITPKTVTVVADDQCKVYGDKDKPLTYKVTGALEAGDTFSGSLIRDPGEDVGSYPIRQGSLSLGANYMLLFTNGKHCIAKRAIMITAAAKNKIYGDADPGLTYTFPAGSLVGSDTFSGSLTRDAGENIGSYAIKQGTVSLSTNYSLTYTSSNLTIGTRAISIAADPKNKTYGDADPALSYQITAGTLATGDAFSGSLIRATGNSVGSYAISQGSLTLNSNYALIYTGADLNIGKRSLAITANDQSKVYGSANPAFTLSYNGFASGDGVASLTTAASASSTATVNSAAGTYPIHVSGAVSPNYSFSYVPGKLQISKASLTITADNKFRIQGTANPALTLSYSGFVNGETSAVLTQQAAPTTTATVSSLAGNYPIQVSGATAANYMISFVNGVLTVAPGSPTSIAFSQAALFENQPAGTAAGSLSSTSGDPNANYTYTLVSGSGDTDNSLFSISGNKLNTTAPLNYESKATYNILVRATTAFGLTLDQQMTINLSDVNEVPTIAAIADQKICYTTDLQTSPISGISAGPETSQTVSLAVSSSDPKLFESLTVSQANANGQAELKYRLKSGASGTATITVQATDNGGIANAGVNAYSRTFTITVNMASQSVITVDNGPEVRKGDLVKLTATGGSTYSWSNASGIISGQQTAVLTARPTFTTTYEVKITNPEGCVSVQEMTISVREDLRNVIGNNILTPNGDGVNDKFVITNIDMYDNELKIFDRAGRILYTKKNYKNDWEGTFNNQLLAEDTYYYIVDFGPAKAKLKGFFTIARD